MVILLMKIGQSAGEEFISSHINFNLAKEKMV